MDTGRKCSHCGHNGHNSRTCNGKGLKLFGVRIMGGEEEEVMRKCSSMVNLVSCAADQNSGDQGGGYLSDGPVHGARRGGHERKRGVPWTQEEHKTFLAGLKKLGKGDWRGISRNYVRTRTPTQVASHAQKYFLRRTIPSRKKRRSSLFDVEIKDVDAQSGTDPLQPKGTHEAAEEINLLRIDTYTAGTPAPSQVSVPSFEVSPMLPPTARCGEQPHFFGFKYMAGTSYSVKNQTVAWSTQVSPTLSFTPTNGFSSQVDPIPSELHDDAATGTPDFLRLSLNALPQSPPACCPSTDDSLSMEASDLDLTIGPPKPLGTAKLSSGSGSNLTGAIRVT